MTISEHRREVIKKYLKSEKGKAKLKRKYLKRVDRERAREAVNYQVRIGKMKHAKEMICIDCGNQADNYHHESYKPEDRLKVIPLCKPCHHARHGQPPPHSKSKYP